MITRRRSLKVARLHNKTKIIGTTFGANSLTTKGQEYTRFHAFFNCQDFRLTANRGSVDITPFEILEDIKSEVEAIYHDVVSSDDWRQIEWLEEEVVVCQ